MVCRDPYLSIGCRLPPRKKMSGLWFCIFFQGGRAGGGGRWYSLINLTFSKEFNPIGLWYFLIFLGTVYNDTLYFLGYSNKTVINLAMILRDIWRERTETIENKVENEKRQKKACRKVLTLQPLFWFAPTFVKWSPYPGYLIIMLQRKNVTIFATQNRLSRARVFLFPI